MWPAVHRVQPWAGSSHRPVAGRDPMPGSPIRSGRCRSAPSVCIRRTRGPGSKASCGSSGPGPSGERCPSVARRGRPSTTGSAATPTSTASATLSNAASTRSGHGGVSPPATTRARNSTPTASLTWHYLGQRPPGPTLTSSRPSTAASSPSSPTSPVPPANSSPPTASRPGAPAAPPGAPPSGTATASPAHPCATRASISTRKPACTTTSTATTTPAWADTSPQTPSDSRPPPTTTPTFPTPSPSPTPSACPAAPPTPPGAARSYGYATDTAAPSEMHATITQDILGEGTDANPWIRPPGSPLSRAARAAARAPTRCQPGRLSASGSSSGSSARAGCCLPVVGSCRAWR